MSESTDYRDFLRSKIVRTPDAGFDPGDLAEYPFLFPWQSDIVRWALRKGRAALFEDCGLGKGPQALVFADAIVRRTGLPVLVLTPLAVGPQMVGEAEKFGISNVRLCSSQDDVPMKGVSVTNYQKLLAGRFDPSAFIGVILDESSVLKNFTGKTKQLLIESFKNTPYRLCCTATPAPNDHMELGNHAEFLGVMPSNEMLARWFIADQGEGAGNYRLKGHAEKDFWRWVCSWAVCISKPSDLGYPDDGYELPPLHYHQHIVNVDQVSGAEPGKLLRDGKLTATTLHREMRLTAAARAEEVANLVNGSDGTWVVWCNTDYEADELRKRIPDIVEVRGSHSDKIKEARLSAFTRGEIKRLLTKAKIGGYGLNWQHCHNTALVGLSYSHEDFYQLMRRFYRFGQEHPVNVHLVIAATEGEVLAAIQRKERDHERMRQAMREAMREQTLCEVSSSLTLREIGHEVARGDSHELHLGDNVEVVKTLPDKSMDLLVFSPPFAGLYIYSDAMQDMGNAADDDEFFRHFGYLVPELLRITVPGRLCVVHCKDLPIYANGSDKDTAELRDFPGGIISLFRSHGWCYHSRVTIWKCPVVERERTNRCALLHASLKRDSSQVGQGLPDYLLVFRRPVEGEDLKSDKPIERPNGIEGFVGDPTFDPRSCRWHPSPYARKKDPGDPSIAVWQRYADPVWWDIDQRDTLNEKLATVSRDEKHICPLQLGLVRRCIHLWSLPGETVFSPFAGVGSEGVVAIEEGRKFVGIELKREYWNHAVRELRLKEEEASQPSLLDLIQDPAEPEPAEPAAGQEQETETEEEG